MMERLLTQAQAVGADEEKAKEIMKLRGYLMDNCYDLRDYRLEVSGEGLREGWELWKVMWISYLLTG